MCLVDGGEEREGKVWGWKGGRGEGEGGAVSVRHKKGRGWNVSRRVVEWKYVVSHWDGFAMPGLTRNYFFTRKKLSPFSDLDARQYDGYRAIALSRTTYVP